MKRFIYILFGFICMLVLCGCENSIGGYEVQNIEMLNEVINSEYVNYTCRCSSQITTIKEKEESTTKTEYKTYVEEGKAFISKITKDCKVDFYEEVANEKLNVYCSTNGGLWEGPIVTEESVKQSGLVNFGEITAEMFEYIEGVWVGNIEEIEKVLRGYIQNYLNETIQNSVEIVDFALKRLDIEISDSKLKRQVIEIEYTTIIKGVEYKVFSKYIYNYSKIGNTVVTTPSDLNNK